MLPVLSSHASGAKSLLEHQAKLPSEERYIRHTEEFMDSEGKPFTIVLCMSAAQSKRAHSFETVTADVSFQRCKGWKEFTLWGWDEKAGRCESIASALGDAQLTALQRTTSAEHL